MSVTIVHPKNVFNINNEDVYVAGNYYLTHTVELVVQ
jgi:hypothetical protein